MNKTERKKLFKQEKIDLTAKKRSQKMRYGYIDGTDFHFELGQAPEAKVYRSPEDLIQSQPCCATECGIYRVKVTLDKDLLPGLPFSEQKGETLTNKDITEKTPKWRKSTKRTLKHAEAALALLRVKAMRLESFIDKLQKSLV